MAFERLVEIGYVGAVMLVVMDLHRFGVDVRFQRVERIRQGGNCECHGLSSRLRWETISELVSGCNIIGTAFAAPNRPALTIPLLTMNLRRCKWNSPAS